MISQIEQICGSSKVMVKFYIEKKKANVNASAIEGYLAAFGKDRMDKKKSAVYLHAFRLLLALF